MNWGAIAGGFDLISDIYNNEQQKGMAHDNRQFQEDMWHKQNWYNDPRNQRRRLEAANLNVGLMYGGGGLTNTASAPNTSNQSIDPHFKLGENMRKYFDIQQQTAQTDNAKKQNMLLDEQINESRTRQDLNRKQVFKTDAEIGQTLANTDTSKFDLSQKKRISDVSFDSLYESWRKSKLDNDNFTLRSSDAHNESVLRQGEANANISRTQVMTALDKVNLNNLPTKQRLENAKVVQEIKSMMSSQKQIDVNTLRDKLKQSMEQKGIDPSHNPLFRVLDELIFNRMPKVK